MKDKNKRSGWRGVVGFLWVCTGLSALVMVWGCGEEPAAPPVVELGTLEVWAYYDSVQVDTIWELIPAPEASVTLDDDTSNTVNSAIPVMVEGILPGTHSVFVEWEDYNKSLLADIPGGQTTVVSPILTMFAPEFTAPGLYYDPAQDDSLAWMEEYNIADHWGEVILMFYFGAT